MLRTRAKSGPRAGAGVAFCAFVSVVVVVSLLAGCTAPRHPTWKNATGAEQYERMMWKAIEAQDWNDVDRHLAPIFIGVNSSGQVFDHAGWIEYWKAHPVKNVSLGQVSVQPAGEDMIVTYVLDQADHLEQDRSFTLRAVSVWKDVKGRWILTAISCTPVRP
ncbi:MAG TPA: nuclear transport factor 2 family protein [Terriglobales bacterium]|nr:nuclear transport factor 2 family protein [Terriglobales bacterium]